MKITMVEVLLLSTLVAQAKTPTPVYDQTGVVTRWVSSHDYNASVTANGHTTFVGCNVSGTNASCDESTGGITVTLADGTSRVLADSAFIIGGAYPAWEFGQWRVYSPLADKLISGGKTSDKFNYRLVPLKVMGVSHTYLCVPTMTKDKHDNPLAGEACYF